MAVHMRFQVTSRGDGRLDGGKGWDTSESLEPKRNLNRVGSFCRELYISVLQGVGGVCGSEFEISSDQPWRWSIGWRYGVGTHPKA